MPLVKSFLSFQIKMIQLFIKQPNLIKKMLVRQFTKIQFFHITLAIFNFYRVFFVFGLRENSKKYFFPLIVFVFWTETMFSIYLSDLNENLSDFHVSDKIHFVNFINI